MRTTIEGLARRRDEYKAKITNKLIIKNHIFHVLHMLDVGISTWTAIGSEFDDFNQWDFELFGMSPFWTPYS